MSAAGDQFDKDLESVSKYLNDRLDELRADGWTEAELAELETSLARAKQSSGSFPPTPEQAELIELALRLMNRQGTIIPDFKALYKRKFELDWKLLGGPDA